MSVCTPDRMTPAADQALAVIREAIVHHPYTGGTKVLVQFLLGCYNGSECRFDLTDLRVLDPKNQRACLDYLAFDALGHIEVHHCLPGGAAELLAWSEREGVLPKAWRKARA